MNTEIPNNIILTWKDNDIPDSVLQNIKILNPNKTVLFFTDKDIIGFLDKEYGKEFVDFFYSIKLGCFKADFFRYCYLYKHGGYYCDIDIEHIKSIDEYIDDDTKFFTVISAILPGHIFQALLFVAPGSTIIKDCIDDMFKYGPSPPITKDYEGHPTTCMYKNIKSHIEHEPTYGCHTDGDKKIQLGIETVYNGRYICVSNNMPIAFSRYTNYSRESGFVT